MNYLERPKVLTFVLAILAGVIGVLTKLTTFPAFGVAAGIYVLYWLVTSARLAPLKPTLKMLAALAVVAFLPILIGAAWVAYSDSIKSLNAFGSSLTSEALQAWNFGALQARLSLQLWQDTVLGRMGLDIFGYAMLPAAAALGISMLGRAHLVVAAAAICSFLSAILLFTNLHAVHNYYQTANAIFAVGAVAAGLHLLAVRGRKLFSLLLLGTLVIGQVSYFNVAYAPWITGAAASPSVHGISVAARAATTDQQSLLVFGTDWSSEVPYYSGRRSLAVPGWANDALVENAILHLDKYLRGYPLGAIVDCFPADSADPKAIIARREFAQKSILAVDGNCRLFAP